MTPQSQALGKNSTAFALSAAIACLFNTALAWAKDSSPALNKTLASLTGHHWISHGIADLIVFIGLGLVFTNTGASKMNGARVVSILVWSVIVASVGLAAWFLFV